MTLSELKERQSWSLNKKIDHSLGVIEQFIANTPDQYVAFSGGKDSTVLLDLTRIVKPDMKACFINTGNEYPDIVRFVRGTPNVDIIYPKLKPIEVLEKYGFPLISKNLANHISLVRKNPNSETAKEVMGIIKNRTNFKRQLPKKYMLFVSASYDISDMCCGILKKQPAKQYSKKYNCFPIIGQMASESVMRRTSYIQSGGCNTFGKTTNSKPLSIWMESDIWEYINRRKLPISDIYRKGATRTGCMFCGFGCQFKNDNRLQLVHDLYPKAYEMFMNYENNGVTYRTALRKVLQINGLYLPDEKLF